MTTRLSKAIWLVVAVLVAAGCVQESKQEGRALAIGPNLEAIAAPSAYAARAITAAGGVGAWTKTKTLELDCVVAFYQADDTYYLTEQRYEIFPWSNSVRISGGEPAGDYCRQLSQGQFTVLRGKSEYEGLQVGVPNRCFAEAILNVTAAPAQLLADPNSFTQWTKLVKVDERWHSTIERSAKPGAVTGVGTERALFYQDTENSLVDVVRVECGESGVGVLARGYDYREVEKGGVLIPGKIELFLSDASGVRGRRVIRIDVK